MSSAHRPTWDPAKGRADERHKTQRVSSRDLPAHTKLKFRQPPQQRRSTARAVDDEREASSQDASRQPVSLKNVAVDGQLERGSSVSLAAAAAAATVDPSSDTDSGHDSSSDEEEGESDEEDDTAALMRELEKIKRERAEEKERREQERKEREDLTREEEIASGNPLLNLENALKGQSTSPVAALRLGEASGYGVKRRWDDDAIFKDQAAGSKGADREGGFVNDLTRSEFHKKFMQRYIR